MVALSENHPMTQALGFRIERPRLSILAILDRTVTALLDWQDRMRGRQILAGMDQGFAKDCALSAADIEREVRKPFWQD